MAWYNSSWLKRKPITLTGGSSGAQSDYQVKLTVTYDSDMKSDFSDLRFTKADGTTLIDSWLEDHTASTSATVWVETDTPANTVDADIFMYYGNSGASSDWDIGETFLLGDDFAGSSVDTGKWNVTGSPTVTNSEVSLSNDDIITSIATFGFETVMTAKSKANEQDSSFVGYYTDANNRTQLQNSDFASPDDFDRIGLTLVKGGSSTVSQNDGWSDFRNTYYKYTIKRISGSLIEYSQGSDSNTYTNSSYIATGDMSANIYVWDSSQESTLTADWIFVRKYAANPATYGFGSEESESTGHPTMRRWGGIPGMRFLGRQSW